MDIFIHFANSGKRFLKLKLQLSLKTQSSEQLIFHFSNYGHNIFRFFDILPNFYFTTSEKEVCLLVINVVYISCLKNCRSSYELRFYEVYEV